MAIPTLGTTAQEIYRNWEDISRTQNGGHFRVVGIVVGCGTFFWRNGKIYREFKGSSYEGEARLSTYELATNDDLSLIDWAIEHGALQVAVIGTDGVAPRRHFGRHHPAPQRNWHCDLKVLHQATGRALA